MDLNFKNEENGLSVSLDNKKYSLKIPEYIWKSYPENIKEVLIDNLAYLLTINVPLMANEKEVNYNIGNPLFKNFFHNLVIRDLPGGTEDYKQSTKDFIKRFLSIKYKFKDDRIKMPGYWHESNERAIIPLSFGKDSLLTLAMAKEIDLEPICIYVNDTVVNKENRAKLLLCKKINNEFGIKVEKIENNIEKINDFEFWDGDETCINYSHMTTGFCFIGLPFANYYKAGYIVLGNQQDMNFSFKNKEGFLAYPAYDQTKEYMRNQDLMIKMMSNKAVSVISLIEPLTNIAIVKILHSRYREIGKYQFSCDCLNVSNNKRWCWNCSKCARLGLFMLANNIDVKNVGLRVMLEKKHRKLYALFNGKEVDHYEKSKKARDQQLLAFYMASKNNVKGYLIELFKKKFLEEAKEREDELYKKFFKIYESSLPRDIKSKVESIYREELCI